MNLSHVSTEPSTATKVVHTTTLVALAIMVKRPGHRTQLPAQQVHLEVLAPLNARTIPSLWAKINNSQT